MIITYDELIQKVEKEFVRASIEEDNYGQIIIYTGLKRRDDNSYLLEDYESE